ncbi:MAG: hypothetical protein U0L92_05635 [Clostridia bacterium]|nr:hypothetical protein [Clostridia bacterium]
MRLPTFILNLLAKLEAAGFQAFVVGGCVRDYMLGLEPEDWDICTAARPEDMLEVFHAYTVIPTGIQHGTVTVITGEGHAEVTTFRNDGVYTDSRHPQSVTFVSDITQDLARRDFTVNAMAYTPNQGMHDPFGGKKDLQQKLLRCVGKADKRLQEDALRILRALRFSAVYELTIEPDTAHAMLNNQQGLIKIARERVWAELKKTLKAKQPGKLLVNYPSILSSLFQTNFFADLARENPKVWENSMKFVDLLPCRSDIRLAGLLSPLRHQPEVYEKLVYNLKPDNETKQAVLRYLHMTDSPLPSTLPAMRRMVGALGFDSVASFLSWKEAQAVVWDKSPKEQTKQNLANCRENLAKIRENNLPCRIAELAIDGDDCLQAGIPAGREIGLVLQRCLNAVIDEKVPNEKKALRNLLFL